MNDDESKNMISIKSTMKMKIAIVDHPIQNDMSLHNNPRAV